MQICGAPDPRSDDPLLADSSGIRRIVHVRCRGADCVCQYLAFLYRTLDRRDRDHDRARGVARQAREQGVGIMTTPQCHPYLDPTPLVSFDTVRATPAIRAIRNRYGVSRITEL